MTFKKADQEIKKHLTYENRPYIMFDKADINWFWTTEQVERFITYWENGVPLKRIAGHFKRPIHEIGLLLIDLELQEKIKPRKGGVWGF